MSRRHQLRSAAFVAVAAIAFTVVVAPPVPAQAQAETTAVPTAPATPVLSLRRLPGVLASAQADARLQAAVAPILAMSTPTTCLAVRSEGRSIQDVNGQMPLVPASTEKLLTATVVLDRMGAGTKLSTEAVAAGEPDDGVIGGDLYVVGDGDPLLATSGYTSTFEEPDQRYNDFARLADAIKAAGVTEVKGGVVGDESRFDAQRYVPTWPGRYIRTGEIGPLGALTVNGGFTGLSQSPDTPSSERQPGEPALLGAETLISLLRARGVEVSGGPSVGKAPDGTTKIAALDSLSMGDTVGEMLRSSDNITAEILLKDLAVHAGSTGTTADGARVVQDTLGGLGLPTAGSKTIDGSGLDLGNRVTCDLLVAALDRQGPTSALAGDLPVAGRTGTLRKRMRQTAADGNVRAKTGTLNEVSALAGFAHAASGEDLTFALIINGTLPAAVDLTDQVAVALAQYGAGLSLDALGPQPTGS